jgi:hypothetical protein
MEVTSSLIGSFITRANDGRRKAEIEKALSWRKVVKRVSGCSWIKNRSDRVAQARCSREYESAGNIRPTDSFPAEVKRATRLSIEQEAICSGKSTEIVDLLEYKKDGDVEFRKIVSESKRNAFLTRKPLERSGKRVRSGTAIGMMRPSSRTAKSVTALAMNESICCVMKKRYWQSESPGRMTDPRNTSFLKNCSNPWRNATAK